MLGDYGNNWIEKQIMLNYMLSGENMQLHDFLAGCCSKQQVQQQRYSRFQYKTQR